MDRNGVIVNGKNGKKESASVSDKDLPLCFVKERHLEVIEGIECITQMWRMKERMKTVSVALVLCLNVGVDPPDVVKTQPCARLECWIDPLTMSPTKALEKVGTSLQTQYERWQPRARYKQSLDPTTEEVKKLCTSLRRNAKEERVLFHYNGHGVPKPTANGEIWVFNRTYTQYIPLSIYDLQTWMGAPSIYVYDCSNAGIIVESFEQFAKQHESEYDQANLQGRAASPSAPSYHNCIQLAACASNQVLPMNPDLPADLFTACLTTPIKVALRWFIMQSSSKLVPKITLEEIDSIPGQISDRRTMKGELNWIFTAITDTIAWNILPMDLFQKLFRQDLLVASLFRNFLLAERIMRSCDCTPVSSPKLPPTHQHPMWNAWDLALDLSLGQLHGILYKKQPFQHLPFFEEQLTAFQVWLELGSEERPPPEQLPIVLQVLLSQVHRMRALELLGKFLDLGPWAVNLALSVGIFPYVLKLLQSCAKELRPLLVFIWAKILAVDNTCQADLVRDSSHKYFLSVLQDTSLSAEYRMQAAFVLACIVYNYHEGKEVAMQGSLVSICLEQLNDPNPQLRQWVAICLGRLWDHYEKARWTGVRDIAHEKLYALLHDPCPEVRAAAVYALGTFINSCAERTNHANNIDHSVVMTLISTVGSDMSTLVRKELINALQWIVLPFEALFIQVVLMEHSGGSLQDINSTPTNLKRIGSRDRLRDDPMERMKRVSSSSSIHNIGHNSSPLNQSHTGSLASLGGLSFGTVYSKIWTALCNLETDPYAEVASMCSVITGHIRSLVKETIGGRDFVDTRNSSLSLPPSPNRGSYLCGESPPNIHLSPNEIQKYSSRTLPSQRTNRKYHHPCAISEECDEKGGFKKFNKSLVNTKYVEWASKIFAQPAKKEHFSGDMESKNHYEKEWRYIRNDKIRKEAVEEQKKALSTKLDCQVFNTRTNLPPSFLQFHPFDQQIAVAGRNSFSIIDWGSGVKNTSYQNKSLRLTNNKISAMEWINGHDVAMLMVAIDDGSVKVFRPVVGSREPRLITAWQAFNDIKSVNSGVILSWEQWTQTVITAGDSRVMRFWDAEKELKAFDIPTGTDSSVSCIDSSFSNMSHEKLSPFTIKHFNSRNADGDVIGFEKICNGYVVVGCMDGSVRLFDRRCAPNDTKVKVWLEHNHPVLGVQMLRDNLVISGSTGGDIKLYDIRKNVSINTQNIQNQGISCLAIHRNASIYSCGTPSQSVCIYNLQGSLLNSFKFYEGFMSHRIGPINCLCFHPHKVVLATGTADNAVSVYSVESRR